MARDFRGSEQSRDFLKSPNRDRLMSFTSEEEPEGQMAAVLVRTTNTTGAAPPANLHALARGILDSAEFIPGLVRTFSFDLATPGTVNEGQQPVTEGQVALYLGRALAIQTFDPLDPKPPVFSKYKLIRTGFPFVYCITERTYPNGFPTTPTCTTSRGEADSVEIEPPTLPPFGQTGERLIFLQPSVKSATFADASLNPSLGGITPPACCILG